MTLDPKWNSPATTKDTALTAVRSGDAVMGSPASTDAVSGLGMYGGPVGQGVPGTTQPG